MGMIEPMRRTWLRIGIFVCLAGAVGTALIFPEPSWARWLLVSPWLISAAELAWGRAFRTCRRPG